MKDKEKTKYKAMPPNSELRQKCVPIGIIKVIVFLKNLLIKVIRILIALYNQRFPCLVGVITS